MTVAAGARLGPYEIASPLGAGGMGEVYKARDTRLERTVAIKILPAEFASDPDLRARFEREARAIAALDHPHICALHDVGEQDGVLYLVMQHLEGETLQQRLARTKGPLSVDQALTVAIQIADALDKAHRAGITHRDLKPANIMLTKSGAKLLDFGLAKLRGPAAPISMSGMTRLATATPNTAQGTILGTVHYMAPEQVEGREADARADIWALGVLLYEMLTGVRPFEGTSAASVIGSILKDAPPPMSTRRPLVPPPLDHIVARCLERDPDERWQTAADMMRELRWASARASNLPASVGPSDRARTPWLAWSTATTLAVALLALVVFVQRRPPGVASPPVRFVVSPPAQSTFSMPPNATVPMIAFDLSPDGRALAFVAESDESESALWVRTMADASVRRLPGTEDAELPFWSPDSRSIAFFANGKLKRAEVNGGPIQVLCDAPDPRGGAWGPNNIILFSLNMGPLLRISPGGGTPTPVTSLNTAKETDHRWPSFLPDGEHFLYFVRARDLKDSAVYLASFDAPQGTKILSSQYAARYSAGGYVLSLNNGTLLAQRFDASRNALSGEPVAIADDVGGSSTNFSSFSTSTTGLIAYAGPALSSSQLVLVGRTGDVIKTLGPAAIYSDVQLSHDNSKAAITRLDPKINIGNVWIVDMTNGLFSPLTFGSASNLINSMPVWSPDDREIYFRSTRENPIPIFRRQASGVGNEELIAKADGDFRAEAGAVNLFPTDVSPDGRTLLFEANGSSTGAADIWALPLDGTRKPVPVVRGPATEFDAHFSPDGRFIAYTSNESNGRQVYVQAYPGSGGRWQVSIDGGSEPRWRRDGRELFFIGRDRRMMAVPIRLEPSFEHGVPAPLFKTRVPTLGDPYHTSYAVSRNGQQFLIEAGAGPTAASAITIVANWPELLKK
jgi:serine/threonine protein kinase/Tol biopolymer transport system component